MIKLHELLEVEENEEFEIKGRESKYRIKNNIVETTIGRSYYKSLGFDINYINEIKNNIIRKPKFPKNLTNYYYIDIYGCAVWTSFESSHSGDILNFRLGNFYLTREEAEANVEKWLNFYENPTQIKWEY